MPILKLKWNVWYVKRGHINVTIVTDSAMWKRMILLSKQNNNWLISLFSSYRSKGGRLAVHAVADSHHRHHSSLYTHGMVGTEADGRQGTIWIETTNDGV